MKSNPLYWVHIQTEWEGQRLDRQPERQLVASVLLVAVLDAYDPSGFQYCKPVDMVHAKRWIEDAKTTRKFSFAWCCSILNWEPTAVQAAILKDPELVIRRLRSTMAGNPAWKNRSAAAA